MGIADLQGTVAGDEADGRTRALQLPARERDGLGLVGLVAEHDDLDRTVVDGEAPAVGREVERLADGPGAGEELVVVAEADVHRRVPHQLAERAEDVAVEQHLRSDEIRVVACGHGEVGTLGREQAADRPLVVVARAVVGEHGEAHRAIERRGRRRERAAGLTGAGHGGDPRVEVVGLQAVEDAALDAHGPAIRVERGHAHGLVPARAPAQLGLARGHAQEVRTARERRVPRAAEVRDPVPDREAHADRADRHEHAERTQRNPCAREAPLQQVLQRGRVGRRRHCRKVDNGRCR